jgi:hypothetical protein
MRHNANLFAVTGAAFIIGWAAHHLQRSNSVLQEDRNAA